MLYYVLARCVKPPKSHEHKVSRMRARIAIAGFDAEDATRAEDTVIRILIKGSEELDSISVARLKTMCQSQGWELIRE